jgi:hypothetical protein
MNNLARLQLKKLLRPLLVELWNSNNNEKVKSCLIDFVYIPEEFNGSNPPKIRYTLFMRNGRTQDRLNCDKVFVELFDDIMVHAYKRMLDV